MKKRVTQLNAYIYSITHTGNLTISFNKPIIVPNIQINRWNNQNKNLRRLDNDLGTSSTQQSLQFDIQEVIDVWVESDFYEASDE